MLYVHMAELIAMSGKNDAAIGFGKPCFRIRLDHAAPVPWFPFSAFRL